MKWLQRFFGGSDSQFVQREIVEKLPESIVMHFLSEFDDEGNPIIFISAPDHEGLISEARTREEAVDHAKDAILTYFDIPRDCARLIDFEVEDVEQDDLDPEERSRVRVKDFHVRLAYA